MNGCPIPDRQPDYGRRIGNANKRAILHFFNNDIARQHQAGIRTIGKRLVRQRRIAGAQDTVAGKINVQLFLQCVVYVNPGQHPESLVFQRFNYPLDRLGIRRVYSFFKSHFNMFHSHPGVGKR